MRRSIRLTILLIVALAAMLIGPSSMADSTGYWFAVYSYELPAGYWSTGMHDYQFQSAWTVPEPGFSSSDAPKFNVSDEAPLYPGYALLRLVGVKVLAPESRGLTCIVVHDIHPDQPTRFLAGWINDDPMTYKEAQAQIDSVVAAVAWDGEDPREMTLVAPLTKWVPTPLWDCRWAVRR